MVLEGPNTHSLHQIMLYCECEEYFLKTKFSSLTFINRFHSKPQTLYQANAIFKKHQRPMLG